LDIKKYYKKPPEKSREISGKNSVIRKIDIFLFVIAIVVLFSIVSFSIIFSFGDPPRSEISVSPNFWLLLGNDTANKLIQEFEEQNPDFVILKAKDETENLSDADVVIFDDYDLGRLVEKSALTSLDKYIHTEAQDAQWIDNWVIPLVRFVDLFAYNIDILKAANLDRPPKTIREFISTARAVARIDPAQFGHEVIYPLALGLSEKDPMAYRRDIFPWIWANEEDFFQQVSDEIVFSKNTKDIFDFFYELDRNDLLAPDPFNRTGTMGLEEFAAGKVAMMTISSRDILYLKNAANDINYSITSIPAASLGKNRLGISVIYAGINSNCTVPDEAWSLLAFIAGRTQIFAQSLAAIPGRYPANYPGEYVIKDSLLRKAWEIYESADIVEYKPDYALETAINETLREKLAEVLR